MASSLRRLALAAAAGLLPPLVLAGCGDGSGSASSPAAGTVAVVSTPTPTPTTVTVAGTTVDVTPCFNQKVAGRSVASLVVPDVVTLDMTQASGFPNGRKLLDPVIDLELNALFLDLSKNPVDTLAKIPLDPSGNDVPEPATFPYLGDAHGGVPVATGGTAFAFRTDAASAYTRVDRMGEPAVATALVSSADKSAFNDDSPTQDATGKWVPEFATDLTALTNALKNQFVAAGLSICATPK